ncbi:MAG: DUF308 domain-containing protein [Rikenella sp.]|nr:DUF308 domain-containing protein [Rikenella sp.]
MEKKLRSYSDLLFGIAAIVVGLVMVIWSDRILLRLIQLIGAISVVIGTIQFIGFLVRTKGMTDRWTYLPIAAPIAVAWGILLLLSPELWKNLFVILIGLFLMFLGLYQSVALYKLKKKNGVKVSGIYFFFSILMMIAGIFVAAQPIYMASWFITFVGAWILAYGAIEIFSYFTLRAPEVTAAATESGAKVEETIAEVVDASSAAAADKSEAK